MSQENETPFLSVPLFNDMHVHLRDQPHATIYRKVHQEYCRHVMAMPNTAGRGLNTVEKVDEYLDGFAYDWPGLLVAIKLDETTTPNMIREAAAHPRIIAAKLYPDGVTTNSDTGLRDIKQLYPVFEAMQDCQLVLSIHPEEPGVFCLDRENAYLHTLRNTVLKDFYGLKIVLEHITTADTDEPLVALLNVNGNSWHHTDPTLVG